MSIKMILFDLDGTLLPMDQELFVKTYFGKLATRVAPHGYDPKLLVDAIWKSTAAMIGNEGKKTNEAVFWDAFAAEFGEDVRKDEPLFDAFYREEFDTVKVSCGYDPAAARSVYALKEKGFRIALATNPIFPSMATECRIRWAGLKPSDFELFTTYENSSYCKPSLAYYERILEALGATADECLMVGNDVAEDMVAQKLGMKVFLMTECLLNKNGSDISIYPQGDFDDLLAFVDTLNK